MGIVQRFLGGSPFPILLEHTKKVHECVQLLRPMAEALVAGRYDDIEALYKKVSLVEHEADDLKDSIRKRLYEVHLLSVGRAELLAFLSYQDDVADAAEDFAVVLLLRQTRIPEALQDDFMHFVDQVIVVSEHLLNLAQEITLLAESAFTGKEALKVLDGIDQIGQEEWKADKMQITFARHAYALESELDPVTLMFLDKYCVTLSHVANAAEASAKYLRQIIGNR